MRLTGPETCPPPDDPVLADVAAAQAASGAWGFVVDSAWELVYMTDEIRFSNGALRERVPVPLEAPWFGAETVDVMLAWEGGQWSLESLRRSLRAVSPWLLADLPDGRELTDPRLRDVLDERPAGPLGVASTYVIPASFYPGRTPTDVVLTGLRLHRDDGTLAGTAFWAKPAAGMSVIGTMAAAGDLRHFDRVQRVARAARRPMAILFADLEGSSPLARRMSTAGYFALGRRLLRAADGQVVDAGGIVGRHAGDGVVAFFLAEQAGSESAAARACIAAARGLREDLTEVGARSGLPTGSVMLRFGLHWGATVHIGQVVTAGRTEVGALGDEVNETARIEACATGGRALASKALVERLDPADAQALDLEPDAFTYTALGEVPGAPEKARRDAPAIAVCDL